MKAILVLALLALFAAPAMADTPTTTTVNWQNVYGTTSVGTVFGDDAHSLVQFAGNNLNGNLWTVDSNDNPYTYGVDSIQNKISASFGTGTEGYGGVLSVMVVKDQNYVPMYGPAGAYTTSQVASSGTGYLGLNTWANYAELGNANYGQSPVPNDWQLQATGNSYTLYHDIMTGEDTPTTVDGALIQLAGSGSGKITDMSDDTWIGDFKMGNGAGCYNNAHVYATGDGILDLRAADDEYLATTDPHVIGGIIPGDGTPMSSQYNLNIVFSGATVATPFQYDNYQLAGGMPIGP